MAAFSYHQHHPFLLDSVSFFQTNPNSKTLSSTFLDETNNGFNCFSQLSSPEVVLHDQHTQSLSNSVGRCDNKVGLSDNENSLTQKQSTDSSVVVDKLESGEQVTQKIVCMEKKRKNNATGSSLTHCATSKDGREVKSKRQKRCNVNGGEVKEVQKKPKTEKKDQKKANEEPPTGYIHVRARRGQATDSHSLAERVRREKISERMKILQKLVPGCDKVTGKALMLDEIINYVQSLQNQVEFLSMKLASVNPLFYEFGMDMDSYVIRPERLNSMASPPLLPLQQCSPTRLIGFAEPNTPTTATTTAAPNDHYGLIDGSGSGLLQGQRPNEFSEDSGSMLWEMEEQRQKLLNPSGFSNNLCSFP